MIVMEHILTKNQEEVLEKYDMAAFLLFHIGFLYPKSEKIA